MTTGEILGIFVEDIHDYDNGTQNSSQREVYVTDGNEVVTQAITLSIVDINDRIPYLGDFGNAGCQQITENSTNVCKIPLTDADTVGSITYSLSEWNNNGTTLSGFDKLQVDSAGNLSFKMAPDLEDPQGDPNDNGTPTNTYYYMLTVSDGENTTEQNDVIEVQNEDEPAYVEMPPPTEPPISYKQSNQRGIS